MTFSTNLMTIGEIVARDYRTAAVFDRFGVDFCCGGKKTVDEACRAKGVDAAAVAAALDAIAASAGTADGADESWDVQALIAHIVDEHHAYVRSAVPRIGAYLARLVSVHGGRHPELARIADHFAAVARDLAAHMYKEEEILFPYVAAQDAAVAGAAAPPPNMFGTVQNPIRMMEAEHAGAGGELAVIRELTNDYRAPDDGCTTYQVCFRELEAFDADLRRHIHLENNVLFPKAIDLEARLAAARNGAGRLGCRDSVEIPGT